MAAGGLPGSSEAKPPAPVRPGRQPSEHLVHLAVLPTHVVGKAER